MSLLQYKSDRFHEWQNHKAADRPTPEQNSLVRGVRARLERKQDARIIIGGENGVGKSALDLRLAEILNPDLYMKDIDKAVNVGVSFTGKQFLQSVRQLEGKSFLEFDEPAQGMYHREFMSEVNMLLSKTLIGFRYKRYISGLCVPNLDLLDIDAVKLANYFIWVDRQGHATVYRILPQRFGGDPYFKTIVASMPFGMPGKELWDKYETRKFANQEGLYASYEKRLDDVDAPRLSMKEIVEAIVAEPDRFMVTVGKERVLHYSRIQAEFGLGINRSYMVKAMASEALRSANKPKDSPDAPPSDPHT